jgi:hypothetical protein
MMSNYSRTHFGGRMGFSAFAFCQSESRADETDVRECLREIS